MAAIGPPGRAHVAEAAVLCEQRIVEICGLAGMSMDQARGPTSG